MHTMAMYLIGDVQGCDGALQHLLDKIDFSPSRDIVYLLGDLVNRGPASAAVLRRLMAYGDSARCLLGNHDLHLLTVAFGVRKSGRSDTMTDILESPDREALLWWLRQQHMALLEPLGGSTLLMVHAGVLPAWTATKTIALGNEVEAVLRSAECGDFLHTMYGNQPDTWTEGLAGADRLRVIVNVLTRLRFCTRDGRMEFASNSARDQAPVGYMPWFEAPERKTADVTVAFGHWSTLGWLNRFDVLALDSGCVWGGRLSALRVAKGLRGKMTQELIQVQCQQSQKPG
jgi:bis(5'-nucleosyl)-tetraphosphatase (symmetrical)